MAPASLPYCNAQDIVALGGRVGQRWSALSPRASTLRLKLASRKVDNLTSQSPEDDFALYRKTRVTTKVMAGRAQALFLPNKPVTSITSIAITPELGADSSQTINLPVTLTPPNQTVFLTGGSSFRYVENTQLPYPVSLPYTRSPYPFAERDQVDITYTSGFPEFVSSGLTTTTLVANVNPGDTQAQVASAVNISDGDFVQIDGGTGLSEVVVVGQPQEGHLDFGSEAVDETNNIISFPYTPLQVGHSSGAVVDSGETGIPEEVTMAAWKLIQRDFFRDIDNPGGAMEVRRGSDQQTYGRLLVVDLVNLDVRDLLQEFSIEVGWGNLG